MRIPQTWKTGPFRTRFKNLGFVVLALVIIVDWSHALMPPASPDSLNEEREKNPAEVSLRDLLPSASVFLNEGEKENPCGDWTGSRFPCGAQRWQYVGPTMGESGNEWGPCIWAHPHDKKTLRIRFPNVQLGSAIGGRAAFIGYAPESGASVSMEFLADGKSVGNIAMDSKKTGWKPIHIPLTQAPKHKVTLDIDIRTPKAFRRLFCIDPTLIYSDQSGAK